MITLLMTTNDNFTNDNFTNDNFTNDNFTNDNFTYDPILILSANTGVCFMPRPYPLRTICSPDSHEFWIRQRPPEDHRSRHRV